jgi:osmoprotectant transport system permease protein
MTGIVLTIAMALLVDLLLVRLGRLIMPWTRLDSAHAARQARAAGEAVAA